MLDIRLFPGSNAAGWVVFASGSSQPFTSPASSPLLDKCAALSALINKINPSGLKGDYANFYRLDAVLLKGARPEVAAKLSLSSPLDASGLLFAKADLAIMQPDDFRADRDAIASAVKSLSVAAAAEAIALLTDVIDSAKAELRRLLASQPLKFEAGGFFAATGVIGACGAARLSVAIDPAALFREAGETARGRDLLCAELSAEVDVAKGGASAIGALSLVVVATADDIDNAANSAIQLLPAFGFPEMPGAPMLRLNFPRLSFPDLRLDGLTFGSLQPELIDIGALLPPAGCGSSIRLSWTNQPKLAVSLVGGGVALPFGPGDGQFLFDHTEIVTLTGVTVATANGRYELKGDIVGTLAQPASRALATVQNFDMGARLPVYLDIAGASASLTLSGSMHLDDQSVSAGFKASASVDFKRIVVRDKDNPRLSLAFAATLEMAAGSGGELAGRLTRLPILDPAPIELICAAGQTAIAGVLRRIGVLRLPTKTASPPNPTADDDKLQLLIDRVDALTISAMRWLAGQAGALAAADAVEALAAVFKLMTNAADAALSHVAVDARLDADTRALRQIIVTPLNPAAFSGAPKTIPYGAFEIEIPSACQPTLLIDVSGPILAALVVDPGANAEVVVRMDLWLARAGAAPEAARDVDDNGQRPDKRLIEVKARKSDTGPTLAAIALDGQSLTFLRALRSADDGLDDIALALPGGSQTAKIRLIRERPAVMALRPNDLTGEVKIDVSAARILPLFDQPAQGVQLPNFAPQVQVTGVDRRIRSLAERVSSACRFAEGRRWRLADTFVGELTSGSFAQKGKDNGCNQIQASPRREEARRAGCSAPRRRRVACAVGGRRLRLGGPRLQCWARLLH